MHRLIADLYPICRSITGGGLRRTLGRLRELFPLESHEVPTGTAVFDWTVPKEWNVNSKQEVTVTTDGPNRFDFDIP